MFLVIISIRKDFNSGLSFLRASALKVIFKCSIEKKNGGKGHFKVKITKGYKLKWVWESSMNCELNKGLMSKFSRVKLGCPIYRLNLTLYPSNDATLEDGL